MQFKYTIVLTGGIGTTTLYIAGGAIIIAAVWMIIVRGKRKHK